MLARLQDDQNEGCSNLFVNSLAGLESIQTLALDKRRQFLTPPIVDDLILSTSSYWMKFPAEAARPFYPPPAASLASTSTRQG
jgi:hypothetical protein